MYWGWTGDGGTGGGVYWGWGIGSGVPGEGVNGSGGTGGGVSGRGFWEEGVLGGGWQSEYWGSMLVQLFMQGCYTSQCADGKCVVS